VTGALFPVVMRQGREDDHQLRLAPKLISLGTTPPIPHTSSLRSV
jgi:hypothetical protein